ncbi:MAG TPA: DUF2147 domain-containing protein [Aestuariivirgaceae bacterium]|nr:DUF2147 domain-containing protein [Aestuariivirgaceae bacterium]
MKLSTDEAFSWIGPRRWLNALAAIAAMATAVVAGPALAATPVGDWLTKDGDAVIRIADCDEAQALCGTIAWVKKPGTDRNNPDPEKREDDIIGVKILKSMRPVSENRWEGEVYNAENGKNYSASITLVEPDVLKISGCVLGGLLCGGEKWKRRSEPLPGEDAPADGAPADGEPTPLTQVDQ